MNGLIVICHGDLTLKKLKIFIESPHLHGWGEEASLSRPRIIWISISEQEAFQGNKEPQNPRQSGERLHNAHLASGWDIWL